MPRVNMKVADLKEIIKDLPDDMDVIIPVISSEDANWIDAFRHVRTAGILSNINEENSVLCLNTAADSLDIKSQINKNGFVITTCDRVLF